MKIKRNKGALNDERKKLALYEKVLAPLELKRAQLAGELKKGKQHQAALQARLEQSLTETAEAIPMLAACKTEDLAFPKVSAVHTVSENVVGVVIPRLEDVEFVASASNLFDVPPWHAMAEVRLRELLTMQCERAVLETRIDRLESALKKTTQRINLFEKVRIPQSRRTIKLIRIALDEMQRSAVIRSKLAKKKHTGGVP